MNVWEAEESRKKEEYHYKAGQRLKTIENALNIQESGGFLTQ